MPLQELPEEFSRPVGSPTNSSLSSNSSDMILINAHYIRNSRSGSLSSSSATNDDSFEPNTSVSNIVDRNSNRNGTHDEIEEEEATYQPIKLPTEPTLEELLVRIQLYKNLFTIRRPKTLKFLAPSYWRCGNLLNTTNKVTHYFVCYQPS